MTMCVYRAFSLFIVCMLIGPLPSYETAPDISELTEQEQTPSVTCPDTSGICSMEQTWKCYLEAAKEMIHDGETKFVPVRSCNNCPICNKQKVQDCSDLLRMGHTNSGVYTIWVQLSPTKNKSIDVYCDMETDGGGWTVIQRRGQFQNPIDYFYRGWTDFKEGFGDLNEEYWLGNENIFLLTNSRPYSARFDMMSFYNNETRHAEYRIFRIDDEEHKYTLHILDYNGTAGDSMIELSHKGKFSTKDQKNFPEESNNMYSCYNKFYKIAWWYRFCSYKNLNGAETEIYRTEIIWGGSSPLQSSEIKIRPRNYRP